MNHLDLFAGIGGFSYAVDQVWPNATHTFCEIDPFCQKVLAKHWPESYIYGDIRAITEVSTTLQTDLVTGGFPCQPFSQAGKRGGTEDDRYLWPEMLRVIRLAQPTWVIGENVGGFVTMQSGLVLEQVCTDLENEGYEVQTFIIPACAVNAPHRRDRVWIVANSTRGQWGECLPIRETQKRPGNQNQRDEWEQNWLKVATRLCRMDDGVSDRVHRLKALGNAIVPQVATEIMKAIKSTIERKEEK